MEGSSRNIDYKMRSMKFVSAKNARSLRIEKQNDDRRMARLAKSNANRGLAEIDLNTLDSDLTAVAVELTQEQKLQDRLNKLKLWREQKQVAQQKEKARKKAPFVVPCHVPAAKLVKETPCANQTLKTSERMTRSQAPKETGLTKPTERVTRSQAKKGGASDVKKTLTRPKTPVPRAKKTPKPQPKWEVKSFAPNNFLFTAPQGIAEKCVEVQNSAQVESTTLTSVTVETPQKVKSVESQSEEIKISPLLANNPWITITRGSSSSKKRNSNSHDRVHCGLPDHQASPMLRQRCQVEDADENVGKAPPPEFKDPRDADYFRAHVRLEESRLSALCEMWEGYLTSDVPEEETGSVRTVIGQAQLLQRERFAQFYGLIDQFENKSGEKEITPTDLEGFWEMIYLQVTDVDRKFGDLSTLRDAGWISSQPPVEKKTERPKRKAAAATGAAVARPPRPAKSNSNLRAHIAAMRKNHLAVAHPKSPRSPSVSNRRRSALLCSPARTPGKRQSLRRSALILSAKKQMFIVTDTVDRDNEPRIGQYTPLAADREDKSDGMDQLQVASPAGVKCRRTPGRRLSQKSLKADLLAAEAGTCPVEPMDSDDVILPDEAAAASMTPVARKAYGKSGRPLHDLMSATSPEERLSAAFDALKAEEGADRATPLKVFRTPAKVGGARSRSQRKSIQFTDDGESAEPAPEEEDAGCRRSGRLRVKEDKGRKPSLLPTIVLSPALPKEDLISFD